MMGCENCTNCFKEVTLHGSHATQMNRVAALDNALLSAQDYPSTWNALNDIKQEILAQIGDLNED